MLLLAVRSVFLSISLLASGPLAAELSAADRQALEDFYVATGGDEWLRNDGWLDDEISPCDWFGVTCGEDPDNGMKFVRDLRLPANNLTGDIADILVLPIPRRNLILSSNRITGTLDEIPHWLEIAFLSGNQLEGPLPGVPENQEGRLFALGLAFNDFEGAIPESWQSLELNFLVLSGNRLNAGAEHAFHAMSDEFPGLLDLAENRFTGDLPDSVRAARLFRHNETQQNGGGGLNLCWNEFDIRNELVDAWIGEHHAGGADYTACLNREREPMDPSVSGSWYDPARDGKGLVLQILDTGAPLLYWFSFDLEGNQQWLFEVGTGREFSFTWGQLLETRGHFAEGFPDRDDPPLRQAANLRLDRLAGETMHLERVYIDLSGCPPPGEFFLCPVSNLSDRLDHVQLTRLAGTTCDNRQPHEWISGAWYDPDRNGEGFVVEVIEDGRAVVYWFTYQPDDSGRQAWLTGAGEAEHIPGVPGIIGPPKQVLARIHIDHLVQPVGAFFGPLFDPDDVDRVFWGALEMEFHLDGTAHVFWDSVFEDYGSGDYPLTRLARPALAECSED